MCCSRVQASQLGLAVVVLTRCKLPVHRQRLRVSHNSCMPEVYKAIIQAEKSMRVATIRRFRRIVASEVGPNGLC